MAKETAEEKLLKVLQKKSGVAHAPVGKPSSSVKKVFSFSIIDINRILIILLVVCGVFLVFQLRSGIGLLTKKIDFAQEANVRPNYEDIGLPKPRNVKFYIDSFGNRNIFKPYDISLGKASSGQPSLSRRLSKYKLVGVAWLDLPESASIMIEDTRTKTTYFLKTGEQLEGVTVKTIYTDRVVFSYENEETTIKL